MKSQVKEKVTPLWVLWSERVALILGMLLGLIAFIWQLQERISVNKEEFKTTIGRFESIGGAPTYRFSVHVINTGQKVFVLQRFYVFNDEQVIPLWTDSTHAPVSIEPGKFATLTTDFLTLDDLLSIYEKPRLRLETTRREHVRSFAESNLMLGLMIDDLGERTGRCPKSTERVRFTCIPQRRSETKGP
jgi:hypothetical protein